MSAERILIVGGDAAGMSAAHQALRTAKSSGREVEVVALEKTHDTSYSACGIPYWLAGDVAGADDLVARSPEVHRRMGIDLRTGVTAVGLDLTGRVVTGRDQAGTEKTFGYDRLVIATGARPVVPEWALNSDGSPHGGVGPVKDLGDGHAWIARLARRFPESDGAGSVVIAGAGYIGIEMAEAALRRGFTVTLLTRSIVMSSLDPDLGERIEKVLTDAGVTVVTEVTVEGVSVDDDDWVTGVATADGRTFPCDLLVLALGVTPATEFAVEAGLPVGDSGGLLADPGGVVAPQVWAAGDCCEMRHRLTGDWVYLPLGTHANKQGRVVGTNLGGGRARFDGVLGTAITRFVHGDHYLEISRTGLSSAEAERAGLDVQSLVTEGTTTSGYMPEAEPIAIKVLAERETRRLVGVQVVGGHGSGKRVDAAAAALWGSMSVDDLAWMDLSYAPPFSTAWEVLQVAARRLAERL